MCVFLYDKFKLKATQFQTNFKQMKRMDPYSFKVTVEMSN